MPAAKLIDLGAARDSRPVTGERIMAAMRCVLVDAHCLPPDDPYRGALLALAYSVGAKAPAQESA